MLYGGSHCGDIHIWTHEAGQLRGKGCAHRQRDIQIWKSRDRHVGFRVCRSDVSDVQAPKMTRNKKNDSKAVGVGTAKAVLCQRKRTAGCGCAVMCIRIESILKTDSQFLSSQLPSDLEAESSPFNVFHRESSLRSSETFAYVRASCQRASPCTTRTFLRSRVSL